jgi:hypothetical protein
MTTSMLGTRSPTGVVSKADPARRRGERRVAHRVPCRVRAPQTLSGKPLSVIGQTVNLSANGMAVQIGQPLDAGTRVEVLLPHLDGEPTRVLGKVAHSRRVVSGTFEVGIWIEPEFATT